jgi:hypothetical protein
VRRANFLAANYRMTELQGAVALAQMGKLSGIVARTRRWWAGLHERIADLPGILRPEITPGGEHSAWFYMLRVDQAALGTELTVPTIDGEHNLKVPEGTQGGTTFRVKGKGVPVLNGRGKGDLFVEVRVQTPNKLSKREKELLHELDSLRRVENKPEQRTLFSKVKDIFQ